jgi:hypothetical protein
VKKLIRVREPKSKINILITSIKKYGYFTTILRIINYFFQISKLNNFIKINYPLDIYKNYLAEQIISLTNNKVKYGLYKDTYFNAITHWNFHDFSSQLLGCYELQIQEKIYNIQNKYKLQNIINIGAGTGYHIISLIKKNYFKKGYAFETNIKAQEILKKNTIKNRVKKKIKILGEGNFITIKKNISKNKITKSLFLIDIEGAEFNFFTKENIQYLNKSHFIIEEHLFHYNTRPINHKQFYKLIYDNFTIEKIKNSYRNPFEYKILDKFSDDEKFLAMSESRTETMQWLYLKPKFIM